MIDDKFLYRALRPTEIKRGVLIPKKPRAGFVALPKLPQVLPYFILGKHVEHAVRAQQWDGRYPTSGVSTTPHLKRAEYYAQRHRTIACIAVDRLGAWGIQMFRVSDYIQPSLIFKPEDDEVILVCTGVKYFPKAIVVNTLRL
jgi:hypothetical protein